ncbi:MAG: phage terminase large subunit family protein [Bdellovibrio sp.]
MIKWAPPPKLTISEWANQYRRLSAESSAEPGKYSSTKAPYQTGIMDAVSDAKVWRVVWMACSQVGKSEILNNINGYYMHYEPCPMMIVQPTLQMAEKYSKDRIAPMIRDTPVLRKLFNLKSRTGDNTLLHKIWPGGNLSLTGANSPASLASSIKKVIMADEIDRYPESAGDEGDPLTLAIKRSATFYNRKIIITSTPTIESISRIKKLWNESDQRRYYVKCPHCKELLVFKWEQIDWDKVTNDPKTAMYICQECTAIIEDHQKMWMMAPENGAKWIAEKPFNGTAGFHINELYSPWRRWWEIVRDYLEAAKNPATLKAWINTTLGETFEEKGDAPEAKRLYTRREEYKAQVPMGALFLTCAIDIQKDRAELQIYGWGRNKERWSIDNRLIMGAIEKDEVQDELDKLLYETFEHEAGNTMMLSVVGIDSGYATQKVYDWARRHPPNRVLVLKGTDHQASIISSGKPVEIKKNGKRINKGVKVWTVGTHLGKSELYGSLKMDLPTEEDLAKRGGRYPEGFIHFPMHYDESYFKQLTAEALIPRTVRGFTKYVWVKIDPRNEALDTSVYNRACASYYGFDRFTDSQWSRLEEALGVEKGMVTLERGKKSQPVGSSIRRNESRGKNIIKSSGFISR